MSENLSEKEIKKIRKEIETLVRVNVSEDKTKGENNVRMAKSGEGTKLIP